MNEPSLVIFNSFQDPIDVVVHTIRRAHGTTSIVSPIKNTYL